MSENIKLEILKLVHRFDRSPKDVIEHAKVYEGYVLDIKSETKVEMKNPEKKKGIFSLKNSDDNL